MFDFQTLYLQYQQYLTIDFISHDFKFHYVLFIDSVSSVPAVLNIDFISHDFKFHYVLFTDSVPSVPEVFGGRFYSS